MAYQAAGKLPEAITLFEKVRAAEEKKLGANHPSTLPTLNNLAGAYQAAGNLPEAIRLFEQVRAACHKKLGADHPSTLNSMGNLGMAYCVAKQGDKAAPLLKELVAGQRKRSPKEDPRFAGLLAQMALHLLNCEQFATAEEMLRESLAIREKKQPDSWTTFNTMSLLGGALLGQKKYAEAEPLLVKGYEGMKAREKTIPKEAATSLPKALGRLIELYTVLEKPEAVKKYQELRTKYPTAKQPSPMPPEPRK
jgi:tetratricopeptide (TPR) repeat protein